MAFIVDGENLDWRVKLIIDKDQIDGNLTDKDVYVDLSGLSSLFWNNVKSDGGDVRATLSDGSTRVPVELKNFNQGAETGQLYIKISSISSSVDTNLYIYWGNAGLSQPAADSTYGSENVWDSGYKIAAHLEESGNGSADEYKDSTSNDNHGQGGGADPAKVPDRVSALVGYGQDHIPANKDHINWGNGSDLDGTSGFTAECLINLDVAAAHQTLFERADASGSTVSWYLAIDISGKLALGTGLDRDLSTATLSASTDYHIAATWDGTNDAGGKKIYINGVLDSSHQNSGTVSSASLDFTTGALDNVTNFNPLDGRQDEIRYTDSDRAAEWLNASSINQKTPLTFYSIGDYETSGNGNAIAFGANF